MRRVFMILSSTSLDYADHCIRTMLGNSTEPISLTLVADDREEQRILAEATVGHAIPDRSTIKVLAEDEVANEIDRRFPGLLNLRALHQGHPCWRKIIDPLALSEPEDEIIIADPDLFFPNRFDFEPTPERGIFMMRQGPNCLYPPPAVRAAFDHGLRLVNHVDIGVAQLRADTVDPAWLDWAVGPLVNQRFWNFMHVEAIIWSAMAMQYGGCHFQPTAWRCWERGYVKRAAVALGLPGYLTLRLEPLAEVKCIHLGGPAKRWLQEALRTGIIEDLGTDRSGPTVGVPYEELTRASYDREQAIKGLIRRFSPN